MSIIRWAPFQDLAAVQDRMNRLFNEFHNRHDDDVMTRGAWVPPVDIFENGNKELVLKAELPAMSREDIDVTVENQTLTIRGEKKFNHEVKDEQYHRVERTYGSFSRSFTLPSTVDVTKVAADYKDGVLTITLPLREEAKPKQIKVEVAA
ncbi:MAG TPA: Hsp20/alpha crystallin family protein [Vicinamibacterales bacterium]|jgi:HSP20 family protein